MDNFKIAQHNSIYHTSKIKISLWDMLSDFGEKIADRDKFANAILSANGWDKITKTYNISPLLWDSLSYFIEAVECYRDGLFLGSAVLCRASIDNALYSVVHHISALEINMRQIRPLKEIIKQGKSFRVRITEISPYDDPQTIRQIKDPKSKKRNFISRKDLFDAGKELEVIDRDIEKKIISAVEKGDIIMHYGESVHRVFLNNKRDQESLKRLAKHRKPLLNNQSTKKMLIETAEILEHLVSKMETLPKDITMRG
ncbi:MAG: hypothetical protein KGI06_01360 [Candidatus Micrarchaeota archaeon]|nr:hypothetical protein [Candidatus Micrarchaeota archaeon]